jgi:hypothetical protein
MTEMIHQVESRRDEFMMRDILKQVPLKVIDTSKAIYAAKLQFRRPNTSMTNLSDPWDPYCTVSEIFVFLTRH